MASKETPSSSVSDIECNFLTFEEILAAVLDSKDEGGNIDSSSSDDLLLLSDHSVDNIDSNKEDDLLNLCDEIEPCFKDSRLIPDISNSISPIECLHSSTGYC